MARKNSNAWRDHVTEEWRAADHAWCLAAEAATNYTPGHLPLRKEPQELVEYRAEHPRPRLSDFISNLAPGWCAPAPSRRAA